MLEVERLCFHEMATPTPLIHDMSARVGEEDHEKEEGRQCCHMRKFEEV